MKRKIRMGMVGGGPGALIGGVHRMAAALDGKIELVAGAFDIDPAKSRQLGEELFLDSARVYDNYQAMIDGEKKLAPDKRIDFVAVCTPNNWHFPIARDFIEAGFHVMCEKPMTMSLAEALELRQIVEKSGRVFGLMHNYTGYPMVKLAKDLVASGELGTLRKVVAIYPQGWLARPIEREGQQQASWRTDPKQSGAGGCVGDIGSHADNLAEYITGLKLTEVCADLTSFVENRALDDDCNCLVRFENGVKGVIYASQISIGEENGLSIWLYGSEASIEWHQEHPNQLLFKPIDGQTQIMSRGNGYIGAKSPAAARGSRIPAGHPEGFLEAFANHYRNFAETILLKEAGASVDSLVGDFPQIDEGVRGMAFIEAVVASAKAGSAWTKLPQV